MKVANITLQAINNYGSVLQTFATEQVFRQIGCDVFTINYIRETARLNSFWKIILSKSLPPKLKIKKLITRYVIPKNNRVDVMEFYRKNQLHLTEKTYYSDTDLENDCPEADIYCTGSDQTWNTICQGDVPKAFFLHFVPKGKKKISFSASFGIPVLPQKDKEEVKELLSTYSAISVRESSGLDILDDLGLKGTLVLDPTLVVNPQFWNDYAAPRTIEEDYLLAYQLNRNFRFTKYMKDFAQHHHLKIVQLRSRKDTKLENGICLTTVTPQEWLSLIKHAKYVLTDSFHATAFSTIFHRDFMIIPPPRFNSRISDYLSLINLKNRIITNFDDYSYCNVPIDYSYIDTTLKREREKSLDFLRLAIQPQS
ncbi:MAG: polysaccharide pyruvyl transferase family protein [Prevotella sp.]|nr:polysaccharide pyruvyl transferase family protein [Prevotella sp.]